jgi:hypothetical protein
VRRRTGRSRCPKREALHGRRVPATGAHTPPARRMMPRRVAGSASPRARTRPRGPNETRWVRARGGSARPARQTPDAARRPEPPCRSQRAAPGRRRGRAACGPPPIASRPPSLPREPVVHSRPGGGAARTGAEPEKPRSTRSPLRDLRMIGRRSAWVNGQVRPSTRPHRDVNVCPPPGRPSVILTGVPAGRRTSPGSSGAAQATDQPTPAQGRPLTSRERRYPLGNAASGDGPFQPHAPLPVSTCISRRSGTWKASRSRSS